MNLPTFEEKQLEQGTGLTCPRAGCGGKFVVDMPRLRVMKTACDVVTSTCPYCSKVSLLPHGIARPDTVESGSAQPYSSYQFRGVDEEEQ